MLRTKYVRLAVVAGFAAVLAQSALAASAPTFPAFSDSPMTIDRHPEWVNPRAAAAEAQAAQSSGSAFPQEFPEHPMVVDLHPEWVNPRAAAAEAQAIGATSSSAVEARVAFAKQHPYEVDEPSSAPESDPSLSGTGQR